MPVPVWLFPAAKVVGKWALTNGGPPLLTLVKKYGPSAFRGYRGHGFKPRQIVTYVMAENGSAELDPSVAKAPKRQTRRPKR